MTFAAPLTADTPCLKCGYNLRGLTPDRRCPECGDPIQTSLEAQVLPLHLTRWLRLCMIGAALLALAPVMWMIERHVLPHWWPWTGALGFLPTVFLIWIGCRLIASRSFPWSECSRVRTGLRACAVGLVILIFTTRLLQQLLKGMQLPDWLDFDDFLFLSWSGLFNLMGLIGSALLYAQVSCAAARLRKSALSWHARVMLLLLIIPVFMIARCMWSYWEGAVLYVFPLWLPGAGWTDMMLWYVDEIVDEFPHQLANDPISSLLVAAIFYLWPMWNTLLMIHVALAATFIRQRLVR